MQSPITISPTVAQKKFWNDCFMRYAKSIKVSRMKMLISDHAEKHRVLPEGERYQGMLKLHRSPYIVEIMDNMSPNSPIRNTYVMKAAQVAITMMMECILCYYIDYGADQLFVTANADLFRRWVGRRLEPAIDSYDLRKKIITQESRGSGKQMADRLATKEYSGGQLDLVSALSAASLRSMTKRILLIDEADGAKEQLDTGEGNYIDVARARTKAWGNAAKILINSTPTVDGQSAIQKLFKEGDKRYWHVPCPHCKKFQVMIWPGFKLETVAGKNPKVYYQCEHCGDGIFENHKIKFLPAGHWEPTASATALRLTRSYHLPGWYAPLGFSPWLDLYEEFKAAQGSSEKLRSFITLNVGIPFKDASSRPKASTVRENQGSYTAGTVPDGVLFLTMAVDVQTGSKNKDDNNPARLEFEICGHGHGYRTWSIEYHRFEGEVEQAGAGAWADLKEWALKNELIYYRADKTAFQIRMIFVDATDGNMTSTVYQSIGDWGSTFPIHGFNQLKMRLRKGHKDKGDEMTSTNMIRYRFKLSNNIHLIQISTNYYKNHLYNNLKLRRNQFEPQNPGFCEFPLDYDDKYYNMLTAEEKKSDGSFHAGGRRNEALDCRVYNLCAADFWLDKQVKKIQADHKNDYTQDELYTLINRGYILDALTKQLEVKEDEDKKD